MMNMMATKKVINLIPVNGGVDHDNPETVILTVDSEYYQNEDGTETIIT